MRNVCINCKFFVETNKENKTGDCREKSPGSVVTQNKNALSGKVDLQVLAIFPLRREKDIGCGCFLGYNGVKK